CRGRLRRRSRARQHAWRWRVMADQFAALGLCAIDGAARLHGIVGRAFAAPVLEHQLAVLDPNPCERRRVRTAVEKAAFQPITVGFHLEPVDLVGIRAGAPEVPPSDVRILLAECYGCGQGNEGSRHELNSHRCTRFSGGIMSRMPTLTRTSPPA